MKNHFHNTMKSADTAISKIRSQDKRPFEIENEIRTFHNLPPITLGQFILQQRYYKAIQDANK